MYVLPGTPIFKVPESIPLEVSVLTDPTAVAIRALERAFEPGVPFAGTGFGVGSSVVIQGLGPIGILTAAAAKSAGAGKIIAIDSVDVRLRLAEEFGVDHVIDMRQFTKPEDRVQEVLKLTGKVGADVVIECTGVPSAFGEGIEFARSGGRYVEVGHFTDAGSVEVNPHLICKKDLDILGSWVFPKVTFRKALSLLSQRRFPFEKLVTHRLKVNEVARAFELMERKESGKIVIEPGI
jgi:L-iditol 2-dehydrogenase